MSDFDPRDPGPTEPAGEGTDGAPADPYPPAPQPRPKPPPAEPPETPFDPPQPPSPPAAAPEPAPGEGASAPRARPPLEPAVPAPAAPPAPPRAEEPRPFPGAARPASRDRLREVASEVERYVDRMGYNLVGLVGYANAGKTHALKALTHLLAEFDADDRERLRRQLSPEPTALDVFLLRYHGRGEEKLGATAFLDAGGDLYARLRKNEWDLAPESTALLHALARAHGLVFMIDLQPGHFRRAGQRSEMTAAEQARVQGSLAAQEELEMVDMALLFLRAVRHHGGEVEPVVALCRRSPTVGKALEEYRVSAPRLDVPLAVLFTKADALMEQPLRVAPGETLALPARPVGVAPFVHRHLRFLYSSLAQHARRFRFDFAQSFVEAEVRPIGRAPEREPQWEIDGEPASVGLLSAFEYLLRNRPREDRVGRLLRRLEIDTVTALRIHRVFHPKLWRGGRP